MKDEQTQTGGEKTGDLTPETFLADYPLEVREIAGQLGRLILDAVPNTKKAVYPG